MPTIRNSGGPNAYRRDVETRLRESVRKAAQRPEAPASGYRYDAFISYHRDPDFDPWMTKVFSSLQRTLANHLGGKANIFMDVRDIELGDRWTDELKAALRTSKCLIPFIEPAYFASQWCAAEFETFRTRKHAPIVPLAIHPTNDPTWIPTSARVYQWQDIDEYRLQTLEFGKNELATKLEICTNANAGAERRVIVESVPTVPRRIASHCGCRADERKRFDPLR